MPKNISPEAAARSARRSTLASARLSGREVKPTIVFRWTFEAWQLQKHQPFNTVVRAAPSTGILYGWSDGVVTWKEDRHA